MIKSIKNTCRHRNIKLQITVEASSNTNLIWYYFIKTITDLILNKIWYSYYYNSENQSANKFGISIWNVEKLN